MLNNHNEDHRDEENPDRRRSDGARRLRKHR